MDEKPIDERSATSPRSGDAEAGAAGVGPGADEEARVLDRLERIETLDRERAPAGELLEQLRELVHEAEAWARVGNTDRRVGQAPPLAPRESTPADAESAPIVPMVERKLPQEVEGMN